MKNNFCEYARVLQQDDAINKIVLRALQYFCNENTSIFFQYESDKQLHTIHLYFTSNFILFPKVCVDFPWK